MDVFFEKRIAYIAKKFNVFVYDDVKDIDGYEFISDPLTKSVCGAIFFDGLKYQYFVEVSVLSKIIAVDPTKNKMFVSWLVSVFHNFIKSNNNHEAIRFVFEDLVKAGEYLLLFESNKRKDKFKLLCSKNYSLNSVKDFSDINQYKTLSQLFDAVSPFIERDSTGLMATINQYVDFGYAEIPFKNRDFMVYVPKNLMASEIFAKFVGWCTATKGNGMFKSYTNGHKRCGNEDSLLYVIIPMTLFDGSTKELYQIHFESNQFRRSNDSSVSDISIFDNELINFICDELSACIRMCGRNGTGNRTYITFATMFGFGRVLIDSMDVLSTSIRLINKNVNTISKNISDFTELKHLALVSCSINHIDDSLYSLNKLKILSLNDNPITHISPNISKLKSLYFLGLNDTKIAELPNELSHLDLSNGGSLSIVAINNESLKHRVVELLPSALVI